MHAVVVGGGISGLTAAYELQKGGASCTLIESSARPGGILQTDTIDGCTVECGADSFLSAKPWALELIAELGLAGEVIPCNEPMRRTLLVHRGRLTPLPAGLQMMVPTRTLPVLTTPLFSWRTKLRMLLEPFRRPVDLPDRSVAEFVRDHFGPEVVSLLAEPLLSGVYGGSAETLGVQSVLPKFAELERTRGSVTRGYRAADRPAGPLFQSLRGGLGQLTGELASRVAILRGRVEAIDGTSVRVAGDWVRADQVVLAGGARSAAGLLQGTEAGELLARIAHSSATIVALGYRRQEIAHPLDGFGFLVPGPERRHLMACTWVSTKFPQRVPEGVALLRGFLSGAETGTDADFTSACREDLARLMNIRAEPLFSRVYRWPDSLAQYGVGHRQLVERIRASLARVPGVHVIGNAFDGVGIPDCIRLARTTAQAMLKASAGTA